MKKLIFIAVILSLVSCNTSHKDLTAETKEITQNAQTTQTDPIKTDIVIESVATISASGFIVNYKSTDYVLDFSQSTSLVKVLNGSTYKFTGCIDGSNFFVKNIEFVSGGTGATCGRCF